MTHASKRFLQPDAISRITRLELRARQVVEGYLTGLHRSPYFGQSVEFVQHREYVAGDDPRRIDWKTWSKTDKFYIKQYEEDTNLRTTLVLDASESMLFGNPQKFDQACGMAACLAYLLLRQQDAVGLTVFDSEIRRQLPPRTQRTQWHELLAALHSEHAREKSDLLPVLKNLAGSESRRGFFVILSDFFTPRESLFKGIALLRHRGHEVALFQILDDEELRFDYAGLTRFEGLEEAGLLLCDPRSLRDGYLQAIKDFLEEMRRKAGQQGVDYQLFRTSDNLDAVLREFVNFRMGKRASR